MCILKIDGSAIIVPKGQAENNPPFQLWAIKEQTKSQPKWTEGNRFIFKYDFQILPLLLNTTLNPQVEKRKTQRCRKER